MKEGGEHNVDYFQLRFRCVANVQGAFEAVIGGRWVSCIAIEASKGLERAKLEGRMTFPNS